MAEHFEDGRLRHLLVSEGGGGGSCEMGEGACVGMDLVGGDVSHARQVFEATR